MSRIDRLIAPAMAMVAVLACSSSSSETAGTAQVQALPSLAFSPPTVAISTGGSVTWVFGSVGHNVTFDAVAGAPESITGTNMNTSVSRVFGTAGTFTYHCTIHPTMTGSVAVSAPATTGYLTAP